MLKQIKLLFKGKQYAIGNLVGLNNITLKVVDKQVPGCNFYSPWAFEDDVIIITKITNYMEFLQIHYYSMIHNTVFFRNVPSNFLVQKVTKASSKALWAKFEAWQFRNMDLAHDFMIGTDPEIFVQDKDNAIIPAFNFLGSKQEPSKTPPYRRTQEINNVYWDGFQAEFETQATKCLAYQVDHIQIGLKGVLEHARKHNPDAKLSIKTVMDISPQLLASASDEHVAFGCMPSLNVYGMKGMDVSGREAPFRPAGGHLHFGIGKITESQAAPIVKALDAILGVACVSFFARFDDRRRRLLYGLAGEYRLPPHGLEYRVLSNAWLCHPLITHLIFEIARKTVVLSQKGLFTKHWVHDEKETIQCINTCDVDKAKEILKRNEEMFKVLAFRAYPSFGDKAGSIIFNAFMNGIESIIINPADLENNWVLSPTQTWITHSNGTNKYFNSAVKLLEKNEKVS